MRSSLRIGVAASILVASVGCDQVTKQVAIATIKDQPMRSFLADTFRLTYAENPGAFLGLGGRLPASAQFWILTIAVGVLLLGMLVYLFIGKDLDAASTGGLAMIAGGGISNWIDRVLNEGRVVDFMNMGIGGLRTGIFNVADVAIMAGVGVLLLASFKKKKPEASSEQGPPPTDVPSAS